MSKVLKGAVQLKSPGLSRNNRRPLVILCAVFLSLFSSVLIADDDVTWVKKADKQSVKKLEVALKNISALGIDFTADDISVSKIPNGVRVYNQKTGITIRETDIGPYIHTLKGRMIATGIEAVVIRDLIIGSIFDGSYSRDEQSYDKPRNDNHPPPCGDGCHPCPEGMDCTPEPWPEPGCDPDTDPDGCQSPVGDCDPDTAPDGCECPQALMGVSCGESAESLLGDYNNNYY